MEFRIKEARERVGLNQKQLAEALGIKPQTFNGYETGQHDPKSDVLVMIARECHTSVDYLLGCTDNPEPKNAPAAKSDEGDIQKTRLVHNYDKLNSVGKTALVNYSDDLAGLPKYTDDNEKKKQA